MVLGSVEDGQLVGTVTLLLDCPPNQPHRGEIAKMMTRVSRRGTIIYWKRIGAPYAS